jgi:hypothetical protein
MPKKKPQKPSLAIVPGRGIDVEQVVALFRHLTGREPSKEEVEQAKASLEEGRPARNDPAGPGTVSPGTL